MRLKLNFKWMLAVPVLLGGCASNPPLGLKSVGQFELSRYLGTWYEVARLDHSFERGLTDVTASYYLRPDGRVTVVNRGYNPATKQWQTARGVAKFAAEPTTGALKVSFFRPFWADYFVVDLDSNNYGWAVVTSSNPKYFWILSRTPTLDPMILNALVKQAKEQGFATDKLIFPGQEKGD